MDRFGDVLELDQAEIADRNVEPPLDLTIGVVRETYRAGLGYALEARGDIDAVAHQIAVALLDDVAEMNADAGLYALVVGHADVALGQTALHVDGAADGFDYTAELDDRTVAGPLNHAPVVDSDRRVDEVAAQTSEPRQRALLVGARQQAVAGDVSDQNRSKFASFDHSSHLARVRV